METSARAPVKKRIQRSRGDNSMSSLQRDEKVKTNFARFVIGTCHCLGYTHTQRQWQCQSVTNLDYILVHAPTRSPGVMIHGHLSLTGLPVIQIKSSFLFAIFPSLPESGLVLSHCGNQLSLIIFSRETLLSHSFIETVC